MVSAKSKTTRKKKPGRPRRSESGDGGAPVSIRLTEKERELIDQAAAELNISASQLMRDSALKRSVDVLNAAKSLPALRALAESILGPLINPRVTVAGQEFSSAEEVGVPYAALYDNTRQPLLGAQFWDDEEARISVEQVKVEVPSYGDRAAAISALETSTTEFAKILAEKLRPTSDADLRYTPAHSMPDDRTQDE